MVTQVTLFPEPLPNPQEMSAAELENAMIAMTGRINPFAGELNSLATEVNSAAANAEAAAAGLANAVWVSGTTYAAGNVRYSPLDFYNYRRKTAGAGTTDPSLDPTNWALLTKTSAGGSDTTSSAVDINLTSTSGRLQVVAMTAPNKKVFFPAATTMSKGVPVIVIKNVGAYRFAAVKNGGVFVCWVNPGQVIAFGCSDISTSAGVWTVSGEAVSNIYDGNTPGVLNSVNSTFIAVAMLSATKAICAYKNNTSTFLEAVIVNFGSASCTPLAITAEAVKNISIAAQTSSQATVVYQPTASSNVKGYVLDVSGNAIAPGTVKTIHTAAGTSGAEGTGISVLSTTKLLCIYAVSGGSNIKERVLDISGSAITESAEASADTSAIGTSHALYSQVETISATKALVVLLGTASQLLVRLQSITGSTPAPTGSVLSISVIGAAVNTAYAVCIMSSTRAIIIRPIERLYGDFVAYLIDISGATPTLITSELITVGLSNAVSPVSAVKLDASRVYLTWLGGYSLGVDSLVLTITSDDRIIQGEVSERLEPGVTAAAGYLASDALDSTHVMQVCRNASTFLSAKTIEIS